jgi:hypothetical protein
MSLIAIILLILAFFGLGSFTSSTEVAIEPAATVVVVESDWWELVEVDGVQGVIVAPSDVAGFGLPEPYWSPTATDVVEVEKAISESQGELEHYRQYAGFTEDGERKILVNGFCNAESDWTSEIVFVLDGGECYFTAIYNVETAELESFMFNGEA